MPIVHLAAGRRPLPGHEPARSVLPDDPQELDGGGAPARVHRAKQQHPLRDDETAGRRFRQMLLSRLGRVRRGE